jgi:hypothetical protein
MVAQFPPWKVVVVEATVVVVVVGIWVVVEAVVVEVVAELTAEGVGTPLSCEASEAQATSRHATPSTADLDTSASTMTRLSRFLRQPPAWSRRGTR